MGGKAKIHGEKAHLVVATLPSVGDERETLLGGTSTAYNLPRSAPGHVDDSRKWVDMSDKAKDNTPSTHA